MNNLIATPIVDKNGKPTTVHRRSVPRQKTAGILAAKPPRLSAIDRKRQEWRDRSMFGYMAKGESLRKYEHPDLKEVLGEADTKDSVRYMLPEGTTQAELAEMLSVASPATVLRVSGSQNIRTADELTGYLESVGLAHLIEDNSEQMELVEQRMADAGALLESLDRGMSPPAGGCSWADFAEALCSRTLDDTELLESIWSGSVSWQFVKDVGVSNIAQYFDEIMPYEDELTAQQFKQAIAHVKSGTNVFPGRPGSVSRRDSLGETVYAMLRIGPENALSLRVPSVLKELNQMALLNDVPAEEKPRAVKYVDDFIHRLRETGKEIGSHARSADRSRLSQYPPASAGKWGSGDYEYVPNLNSVMEFYSENISVDDAIEYMSRDIRAEKARGLIDNDIAAPLHDGWL